MCTRQRESKRVTASVEDGRKRKGSTKNIKRNAAKLNDRSVEADETRGNHVSCEPHCLKIKIISDVMKNSEEKKKNIQKMRLQRGWCCLSHKP